MEKHDCAALSRGEALRLGARDGIPIGLGYLAVAFSLGIIAEKAGLTAFQGFMASLLCNASAGEYAGFSLIMVRASLWETALITLIANARYLLMSCAMSQRMKRGTKLRHRLLIAFDLTDELFSIAVARAGCIEPFYSYGAMLTAAPCWAIGTAAGILLGEVLPPIIVNALGVALYGMFLAVIIPPARKSRILAGLIAVSFSLSWLFSAVPPLSSLSEGTRTIILTIVISAGAALIFPVKDDKEEEE
ncbi:MAG: AzlC family ABC transporter permease [Eubacteriales bacterium]|nr:AzlC family ABC transporter permease [Eubacteriales bacterium]MDD3883178.1 AzlC family ABC transporter permease [Eubacteriales bacterium]MDD4513351.1 AzlC family ABC transporter permease [Eubacteriales bacterium]